jgi:hypothetical protein
MVRTSQPRRITRRCARHALGHPQSVHEIIRRVDQKRKTLKRDLPVCRRIRVGLEETPDSIRKLAYLAVVTSATASVATGLGKKDPGASGAIAIFVASTNKLTQNPYSTKRRRPKPRDRQSLGFGRCLFDQTEQSAEGPPRGRDRRWAEDLYSAPNIKDLNLPSTGLRPPNWNDHGRAYVCYSCL